MSKGARLGVGESDGAVTLRLQICQQWQEMPGDDQGAPGEDLGDGINVIK
jgi:hypothetical protein